MFGSRSIVGSGVVMSGPVLKVAEVRSHFSLPVA